MARVRDYRREYQQRLARAEALGLSRKQARGHAGDVPKRAAGPPPVQSSSIYVTAGQAAAYAERLSERRRAKLVAVYEDGASVVIRGRKGGMRADDIAQFLREEGEELEDRRQRYREQAREGNLQRSLLIGYQVVWV